MVPKGCLLAASALALGVLIIGAGVWLEDPSNWTITGMDRDLGPKAAKSRLGAIRSALSIYFGDLEGQYPSELGALTLKGRYLAFIPPVETGPHNPSSDVHHGARPNDAGGWVYHNVPGDTNSTQVLINCTHTDGKGRRWAEF